MAACESCIASRISLCISVELMWDRSVVEGMVSVGGTVGMLGYSQILQFGMSGLRMKLGRKRGVRGVRSFWNWLWV